MARGNFRNWDEIPCSAGCGNIMYAKNAKRFGGEKYCVSCFEKANKKSVITSIDALPDFVKKYARMWKNYPKDIIIVFPMPTSLTEADVKAIPIAKKFIKTNGGGYDDRGHWYIPLSQGQGWYEAPDATGKAPEHVAAAIRTGTKDILRIPMVPEKLFLPDPIIPPCKSCGSCCIGHPCGIAPNEVYPIAKHLGISVKALFDTYLTGDYWVGESDDELYVAPRRVGDRPGRFDKADSHWDFPYPPRQCIFLTDKNLCLIHPVKPLTAKESHCKLPEKKYKQRLAKEWKQYFKKPGNRDDDWLDYADRVDYDKLERDFGGK